MNPTPADTHAFVKRITVRGLFGRLDYDLALDKGRSYRLALLYGDNGSGKTTVLTLLYHLLTPVHNRGHKSVVLGTRFSLFEVELDSGAVVTAKRPRGKTTGGVIFSLRTPGRPVVRCQIKTDESGGIIKSSKSAESLPQFLYALAQINVELFFMRDNRRMTSSRDDSHAIEEDTPFEIDSQGRRQRKASGQVSRLAAAIQNVNVYFHHLALSARSVGDGDMNKIYEDIAKHLSRPNRAMSSRAAADSDRLPERLQALQMRSRSFAEFGLTTGLEVNKMVGYISACPAAARPVLLSVLTPYVEGVEARLDALAGVESLLSKFVSAVNSFFSGGKSVAYNTREGLVFSGYRGEMLEPELLSSGERQLLMLLCHLLPARASAAIFVVDEPELSLNVKWQRTLLSRLLELTEGSAVQLVFATHSIEMITPHRDEIVRLDPLTPKSRRAKHKGTVAQEGAGESAV